MLGSVREVNATNVELARGYFERLSLAEGTLLVSGWILLPDRPFNSIRVYVDGEHVGFANVQERADVARVFPWIRHAERSGFHFKMDGQRIGQETPIRIDVLGFDGSQPAGRMSTLFVADLVASVPTPPTHLMHRVLHLEDAHYFKISGLKSLGEYLEVLARHHDLNRITRVLDWGCGCGRVTVYLLSLPSTPEVFGCDIDGEAIAWCKNNLHRGSYQHIDPWPPTPYEDGHFDLVIGHSVFTHLAREAQLSWLREMRRIIAPGGYLIASTHGDWAAYFAFPKDSSRLLRDGINDESNDSTLTGIAPAGYYRGTYQSKDYTIHEWSRYFEILEYVERGTANIQDLILMRRPVVSMKCRGDRSP
jgi:SAM-dependent methyltransferase